MGKLTESQLLQWIRSGKPIAGKSDGGGLTFTLSKSGTAAWVLRYYLDGKHRELTLGRYPMLDLDSARAAANIERARVALGNDVAVEKQERRYIQSGSRRIEMLRREVAKAESELQRFQDAVKVTRARLRVTRLALRIETEGSKSNGQAG